MLGREAHVGQHIGRGGVHERRQLRHPRPGLVGDLTPLLARVSLVRVPLGWHAGAFDFRHPFD